MHSLNGNSAPEVITSVNSLKMRSHLSTGKKPRYCLCIVMHGCGHNWHVHAGRTSLWAISAPAWLIPVEFICRLPFSINRACAIGAAYWRRLVRQLPSTDSWFHRILVVTSSLFRTEHDVQVISPGGGCGNLNLYFAGGSVGSVGMACGETRAPRSMAQKHTGHTGVGPGVVNTVRGTCVFAQLAVQPEVACAGVWNGLAVEPSRLCLWIVSPCMPAAMVRWSILLRMALMRRFDWFLPSGP